MDRSELVKTLELVKPALGASNNPVPIFQCFMLNEQTVSASNDTIAIIGPLDFDWACGIHGTTLLGLLSNSHAEDVELSLQRETATIKLGKTVSKLPFFTYEEFLFTPPDEKWMAKLQFSESVFEAISIGLETVSSDETQPALQGITIQGDKLYSCNGDSLTRIELKGTIGKHRVLLPTTFCNAILKLWGTLKITKGVLQFSEKWAFADFGDWSVYGQLLAIESPIDFEELISRNIKTKVATEEVPDDLSEALSRARVLSDPESQKTVVTVSKGKIDLVTETHMGEIRDTVVFGKSHPEVVANVNASHLQRAIAHCDKIAFHKNCVMLEKAPDVFMLVSNMS